MNHDRRNPKHIYYVSLLNTKDWQGVNGLRAATLRKHPICQKCNRRSSVDVHHLNPVEGVGRYYQPGEELPEDVKAEMRHRCFDEKNVVALCVACHIETHRQMRSHVGQGMKTVPRETNERTRSMAALASKMTGQNVSEQDVARPKKGIRKTRFGWMTNEEYQQRIENERKDRKENLLRRFTTNDIQGTDGTPKVDAAPED